MTVISYITEAEAVSKILTHLGLPTSAPVVAPARRLEVEELEPELDFGDYAEDNPSAPPHPHLARAPPELNSELDVDRPTDSDGYWGA